jgi:succinate dehydrogenase / fumarate reductase cytochrome b subunit
MLLTEKTVLRKVLMAVTGVVLILFVLAHMLGNTSFFAGPEGINAYAQHLKELWPLVWAERIGVGAALILHVWMGVTLTLENSRAKPAKYAMRKYQRAGLSSRTMIYTGLIVLAFLVYHLLHFTFGVTNPELYRLTDASGRHDVYAMGVESFRRLSVTAVYVVAMIALFSHLWHGAGSFFQTMGWSSDWTRSLSENGGRVFAFLLFLGFVSVPGTFFVLGLM